MSKEQLICECRRLKKEVAALVGRENDTTAYKALSGAYDKLKDDYNSLDKAFDELYVEYEGEKRRRISLEGRGFWSRLFNLEE